MIPRMADLLTEFWPGQEWGLIGESNDLGPEATYALLQWKGPGPKPLLSEITSKVMPDPAVKARSEWKRQAKAALRSESPGIGAGLAVSRGNHALLLAILERQNDIIDVLNNLIEIGNITLPPNRKLPPIDASIQPRTWTEHLNAVEALLDEEP